jgi:transcriptional regulator with XRE-family HTH domain
VSARHADAILRWFAANVQAQRVRLGLTQEDVAKALKIDFRYVQRIERGTINVGLLTVERFARYFRVEAAELLAPADLAPAKRGRPAGKKKSS